MARKLTAERGSEYDPRVLARLKRAEAASAADYIDLCESRAAMIEEARTTLWQRFDAIVCQTVPVLPPRIADLEADDDAFTRTNALILRNPTTFTSSMPAGCPCPAIRAVKRPSA